MSFLALPSAWLFLLLIPLVAFYFLKLKRPRHVIPSLVLWRQVLNDQRVNSPFQRFKRNLLLLLQILLLILLVLAAMQPLLGRRSSSATRLPILIDCSASMGALENGVSRLDVAKKRVRELISSLPADQEISLVAFSRGARRLTGFTNDSRELRTALDSLRVEEVPGDLEEVLSLAQAMARSASFERLLLLSDGNFPARTSFELPFRIDFQRLEPAGPNFGITACSARRGLSGQWELFIQLSGSPDSESSSGKVELFQGGAQVASEPVTFVAGSTQRMSFKIASEKAETMEVRFTPGGADSLACDNIARISLPAVRPLDVYVAPGLKSFRHALEAMEGLEIFPREGASAPASYDLVLTDQEETFPAQVTCTVGLIPKALKSLVGMETRNSTVVDWRRDSPLLLHVILDEVVFMDDPHTLEGIGDPDFAAAGYMIEAQGPRGPLLLEKRDRDGLRFHLLVHPDRSSLPYRVGFPVLVANLVQTAQNESKLAETSAGQTGVLASLNVPPNTLYQVEGPDNLRAHVRSDERGILGGIAAPRVGQYALSASGAPSWLLGASLLSPAETSLAGIDQIEFSDQLTVKASDTATQKSDRNLWWPLALAAMAVLLVEWWFFHRRPS